MRALKFILTTNTIHWYIDCWTIYKTQQYNKQNANQKLNIVLL